MSGCNQAQVSSMRCDTFFGADVMVLAEKNETHEQTARMSDALCRAELDMSLSLAIVNWKTIATTWSIGWPPSTNTESVPIQRNRSMLTRPLSGSEQAVSEKE